MSDLTPGDQVGLNPCTICDTQVAITHYNLKADGTTTFQRMIVLVDRIPNVCKSCNFFVCDPCTIGFESKCLCGGDLISYGEFCALFS